MPYTVVGGNRVRGCPEGLPVSVVLLNRGSRLYRTQLLAEMERVGFGSILSVESGPESPDLEFLSSRFPRVRFLYLFKEISVGERINIGIRESCGPFVFVLWNDQRLSTAGLSSRFFERLAEQDILCTAPFLSVRGGDPVPTQMAPAFEGSGLRVLTLAPQKDGDKTLFPFDGCGIYSRERFLQTGGYDPVVQDPWWQKMDFGFRAWLWGEEIRMASALRVAYEAGTPTEDTTPGSSYGLFHLKNLAVRVREDGGLLPLAAFPPYLFRAARNPFPAVADFQAVRVWVRANRYRFRCDARSVVDLWEPLGP
ncbi:MAG TPA: hypothetical protein VLH39_07815 [Magnetospirillaceae bacterium]|nr:hypothetical protein [Magnetospirillaceae bacterium]